MAFPYLMQGDNLVILVNNTPHTVSSSSVNFKKIKEAIKNNDWDIIQDIVDPKKVIIKYGNGNIAIQGDALYWKGTKLDNSLAARIVQMYKDEFPIEPMVKFMENLSENPSKRAVDELYEFIEKGKLPITSDGHFLAYKKVRSDFFDIHSNTINNAVGAVVEMDRNQVDDNSNNTCSAGLHFCSKDYLPHFGCSTDSRIVILKINPRDVVSIPADYNASKGRTCKYTVIGELDVPIDQAFSEVVQDTVSTTDPVEGRA